jgi:hypothetical protein
MSFWYGCLFITNRKEIKSTLSIVSGPRCTSTLNIALYQWLVSAPIVPWSLSLSPSVCKHLRRSDCISHRLQLIAKRSPALHAKTAAYHGKYEETVSSIFAALGFQLGSARFVPLSFPEHTANKPDSSTRQRRRIFSIGSTTSDQSGLCRMLCLMRRGQVVALSCQCVPTSGVAVPLLFPFCSSFLFPTPVSGHGRVNRCGRRGGLTELALGLLACIGANDGLTELPLGLFACIGESDGLTELALGLWACIGRAVGTWLVGLHRGERRVDQAGSGLVCLHREGGGLTELALGLLACIGPGDGTSCGNRIGLRSHITSLSITK